MYVPFSFINARHSSTRRGSSCVSASSSSTSAAVDVDRVRPVRLVAGNCSFSNRISPSCLGELMLNCSPASSQMRAVYCASACSICCDCAASAGPSIRMPARSTAASTGTSGISSSRYTDSSWSVTSSGASRFESWRARSARSPANVSNDSGATRANGTAFAPRPHTSSSVSALYPRCSSDDSSSGCPGRVASSR